jgi:hypothetical protein
MPMTPNPQSVSPHSTRVGDSQPNTPSNAGWFWVLAIVGIGALLIAIAREISGSKANLAGRTRIRIASVPPGEAPQSIREAWIGLELLVSAGQAKHRRQGVFGVLSNRKAGSCDGYSVNGVEAVKLLAAKDRQAAEWWRHNAPHVLRGGYQLVFPAEVCEEVG